MEIDKAIGVIDKKICRNIEYFKTINRGFLSQNILSDLRDLVEHTSLKAFSNGNDIEITYENIQKANECIWQLENGSYAYLVKINLES